MADVTQGGKNLPDYSTLLWDNGKPYWKTANGAKLYVPPASAMSMFDDPQALAWAKSQGYYIDGGREGLNKPATVNEKGQVVQPANPVHMASQSGGLFHTTGTWDSSTGSFESGIDWGNILTIAVAGAIAAPFVAAAVGAAAGGGAGAGAAGGGVGLGETAATTGLATGAGLPGAVAAPTLASIGTAAVPAATTGLASGAGLPGATVAPSLTAAPGVAIAAPAVAAPAAATSAVTMPAATTGLASGAGLPGAVAAPTVADLATVGSSVPGIANAAAIPAAAAGVGTGGVLSKALLAGGNLAGNLLQKSAIGNAVNAQTASQAAALAAQKAGGERAIGILSPWTTVGGAAAERLGQLLHLTPQNSVPGTIPTLPAQQSGANAFVPTAVANDPRLQVTPAAIAAQGDANGMVMMRAPDGSTQSVPAADVPHYFALGARRVA